VRAEIALEPARIAAISVEQANVAFEPSLATGGECCRDPGPRITALVGTPLDGESTRRLGAALGGPLGCSHVLTLAQLLLSRAQAEIDRDAMVLRSLRAAERESGRDAFYGAWRDRSAPLADLAGRSALGGMAAALYERLGARGEDRPLLDALRNLAPTLIQCV